MRNVCLFADDSAAENSTRGIGVSIALSPRYCVESRFKDLEGDFVPMARVCEVCGRGPQFGHRISHAHNVSNRRWNINLQSVRAVIKGASKRIRVCTSCIRSGKVQKAA